MKQEDKNMENKFTIFEKKADKFFQTTEIGRRLMEAAFISFFAAFVLWCSVMLDAPVMP